MLISVLAQHRQTSNYSWCFLLFCQGASAEQPDSSASATDAVRPAATSKPGTIAPACAPPAASRRYATWLFSRPKAQPVRIADMVASNVSGTNNSSRGSLSSSSPGVCSATGGQQEDAAPQGQVAHSSSLAACIDMSPANMPAASSFEVIEQQPPLHQDLALQEPFVMVSSEDAIEGMAYYIALYLSRAPEARYMEPMQLQAALRHTFTAIRRSRYRVIWDWGRWLYRWGGVSYSALQLYEHPWVVRALVAAIWTSSKMTLGLLW
eukprot:GHRR01012924.1.p1 GENE.GHRR01012924.1~~GHRR01012924.1.p1  ORF type:complete len:265 (+),score=82.12 GHRR01012924.1:518-1312(+)